MGADRVEGVLLQREVLIPGPGKVQLEVVNKFGTINTRGKDFRAHMWECTTDLSAFALFNVLVHLYKSRIPITNYIEQNPDGTANEMINVAKADPGYRFELFGFMHPTTHKPIGHTMWTNIRAASLSATGKNAQMPISRALVYVSDCEVLGYLDTPVDDKKAKSKSIELD